MNGIYWGWYDRGSGERKTFETKINHGVSVQELYNIYYLFIKVISTFTTNAP